MGLVLEQNHPNPFNPATTISFFVPSEAPVWLIIYDTVGRRIRTLIEGEVLVGSGEVIWDGRSDEGRLVSSGIYFCHIEVGKDSESRKLVLMR
jgi:flagellar hook assembly protein FlgD